MANPKSKGSSYEREISEVLSRWWSEGKETDIFYRSQSSGARFTSRRKSGKDTLNQSGDIVAVDSRGELFSNKFSVECKTGYHWDLLDSLDSKQKIPVLMKFWNQCNIDAEATNRIPILIFRRNGRSSCICFTSMLFSELEQYYGTTLHLKIDINKNLTLIIMSLQSFFNWIPSIKLYLKEG